MSRTSNRKNESQLNSPQVDLNEHLIANKIKSKNLRLQTRQINSLLDSNFDLDGLSSGFKNNIFLEDILDYKKAQLLNAPQVLQALRDRII